MQQNPRSEVVLPIPLVLRALKMIDPMLSLAMLMHTSLGVYALMLGSGVSRSAKVPTGWEVEAIGPKPSTVEYRVMLSAQFALDKK